MRVSLFQTILEASQVGGGKQEEPRRAAGRRERRVRVRVRTTRCPVRRYADGAKPFGEGLPHEIWKIVEDYDSDTYRAVYTATFPEVVYVLDAFVKKSKSGSKTPQADKDRVRDRFMAAKRDYDEHHRKREK